MSYDPNKVTFFAKTDSRGKDVSFGIKASDRTRHMYVIGKTGMGKSTLLENMAVQDIQNGEGLAFIDPHGQTAETLLNYIPENRVNDVLYFAPFDTDFPVSFNVMEDVDPDKRHLVVSGLMSVFKKIFVDQWSARMEYILSNTLLALLEYPGSTLLGVNRMLSDKDYRKLVIDNITDPSVKSFWVDEFLKYNERYMQEAGDAIKNKIGQFTANPVIRNIIGQPKSSFDIRTMMDEKKILIMNLSKGLIGETNANLLGSMLTTRIYLSAMSRADLTVTEMKTMPNFYFYVDEFQSFANATFANILSEARKYKLNLTIAHQYIEQMEEEVRNAVFGNVGTIVAFRVGPFDAEVLETIFQPRFMATDIVNLGFAQVYLTLMIDGIGSQPFSAVTLPPIAAPSVSRRDMVVAASRKQFGHERADVEKMILKFHEPVKKEEKPRDVTPKPAATPSYGARPRVEPVPPASAPRVPDVRPKDTSTRPVSVPQNKVVETPNEVVPLKQEEVKEPAAVIPMPQAVASETHERRAVQHQNNGDGREVRRDAAKRNEKASREHTGASHQTPRIPKEKSLEDLRNTLKTITSSAAVADDGERKPARVMTEGARENLKAALAGVLKDVPKETPTPVPVSSVSPVSTKPLVPPTPPVPKPEAVIPVSPKVENEIPKPPVPSTPKDEPIKREVESNGSSVSAKELERMMRVTTSDKTPLS